MLIFTNTAELPGRSHVILVREGSQLVGGKPRNEPGAALMREAHPTLNGFPWLDAESFRNRSGNELVGGRIRATWTLADSLRWRIHLL